MIIAARRRRPHVSRLALALALAFALTLVSGAVASPAHAAAKTATFTQVSAGPYRALALSKDGAVYAWGAFAVGDGTTTHRPTPTRVHTPVGVKYTAVAAGTDVLAALTSGGDVYTWGSNNEGALGIGKKDRKNHLTPVKVKRPKGVKFTAISAGYAFVLALASNGSVYAWGSNDYGQLGDGSTKDRAAPVKVKLPAGVKATRITTTDSSSSFAIAKDGTAYAWGLNIGSELGNGKIDDIMADKWRAHPKPLKMVPPSGVRYTKLAEGSFLAIGSDGATYAWGRNDSGNLGNGTVDASCGRFCVTPRHTEPVKVSLPKGVKFTQVESSVDNRFAIGSDGKAYAWGAGYWGLNGNGSRKDRSKPVAVKTPAGVKIRQVSASDNYALAVGSNGKLYAWGSDTFGNGKISSAPAVVKAPALTKLTATPKPRITGTAAAGKTLKVVAGTWKPSGVKRSYQWYRGTAKIAGATKSTYTLTSKDKGKKITVKVSGSAPGFAKTTKTSSPVTVRR